MSSVFVNEIYYDAVNDGSFVEIVMPEEFSTSGWTVHYYDGAGFLYAIGSFGGGGTQVVSGKAAYRGSSTEMTATGAIALVAPDDWDPTQPRVIEFFSYGGALVAQNGPAQGHLSVDLGDFTAPGFDGLDSFQRTGVGDMSGDFTWFVGEASEQAANLGQSYAVTPLLLTGAPFVDDTLIGEAGDDTITGHSGKDLIFGEFGADQISGGGGSDTIFAGQSDDSVTGEGGRDRIDGGHGHDLLDGGAGDDTIYTARGDDTVIGGAGADVVYGSFGKDSVDGGDGQDSLYGERGRDHLMGGAGDDLLDGGVGLDTLDGGSGDDTLLGGSRTDWLRGGADDDLLDGQKGNDRLFGETGRDSLLGEAGNDTLDGGQGNDTLEGGIGDDVLMMEASGGSDFLTGGAGADRFDFAQNFGLGTITDFEHGIDLIDFADIASITGFADLNIYSLSNGDLAVDTFGFGTVILGNPTGAISAQDFIFV